MGEERNEFDILIDFIHFPNTFFKIIANQHFCSVKTRARRVDGIKPKSLLVSSKLNSSLEWPSAQTILKTFLMLSTMVCECSFGSCLFAELLSFHISIIITAPNINLANNGLMELVALEAIVGLKKVE